MPFINIEFMPIAVFQGIGSARQALVLSFFRKGILDLSLMFLANLLWPMYRLMLVQPFMKNYDVWDFELTEEEMAQMTALERDDRFADY